ncbi:polyprenyl synthetase family protein [Dysosmobacter sp.]|uniref:polyprenyl synthetase family protein n=1 Tax=Dysosmobacter sp. TaxID=2591382 RepID=UPI002A8E55E0|nr:farnesyl diphosphate synthase [Dysosmobacter sp.]MDY3282642.1 farnesyl diphosphate synthase [Dysosmobacter sp.]
MEKAVFDARYEVYRQAVEEYLNGQFTEQTDWSDLYDSMRYSLLAGGKRIRPVLTLEFARIAGAGEDWRSALPAACALELVHTYSLIHDDLPCMDDDDLRRGKPTNHKVYGETMAVLAGDALQPAAYERILTAPGISEGGRLECALLLARASGPDGMVAGQVLDTLHAPKTGDELHQVHRLKTSAMISAACAMGCAAFGAGPELRTAAEEYAQQIGIAFQIRDDMLDVIGDEATFGKPIGSDKEEGKVTFADLLGIEGCEQAVRECTEKAVAAIAPYDADGFLTFFAERLASRMK